MICLRRAPAARPFVLRPLGGAPAPGWSPTLPAYLTGPEQWKVFWTFNSDRGADLGLALAGASQQADRHGVDRAHDQRCGRGCSSAPWCLGVLVLGLRAPQTPRLAQLGFLVVAGFLLVNKVYSPQYVLWLLPLAVLARPRWRDQLVWQAGEVALLRAVWWYLGGYLAPAGGGDAGVYWVAILVRVAAELYLVGDRGARRAATRGTTRCARSPRRRSRRQLDDDAVERRRGVAHPDVDLVADRGHARRRAGRNSIEACMCGGSAKSRCLPSMENGERTKPTASRPPRARVAARALSDWLAGRRLEADAVGGAAADHERCARAWGACGRGSRTRRRARPGGRRGPSRSPAARRGRRATGRCRCAAGTVKSGYAARSAASSASVRWLTQTGAWSAEPGGDHVVDQPAAPRPRCEPLARAAGAARRPRGGPAGAGASAGGRPAARGAVKPWRSMRSTARARTGRRAGALEQVARGPRAGRRCGSPGRRSAGSTSSAAPNGRQGVSTSRSPSKRLRDLRQLVVRADREGVDAEPRSAATAPAGQPADA